MLQSLTCWRRRRTSGNFSQAASPPFLSLLISSSADGRASLEGAVGNGSPRIDGSGAGVTRSAVSARRLATLMSSPNCIYMYVRRIAPRTPPRRFVGLLPSEEFPALAPVPPPTNNPSLPPLLAQSVHS